PLGFPAAAYSTRVPSRDQNAELLDPSPTVNRVARPVAASNSHTLSSTFCRPRAIANCRPDGETRGAWLTDRSGCVIAPSGRPDRSNAASCVLVTLAFTYASTPVGLTEKLA